MDRNSFAGEQLKLFVPHQANIRIMDAAARRLDLDPARMMVNIDRFANTTTATIPTALHQAFQEKRMAKGDLVAFAPSAPGSPGGPRCSAGPTDPCMRVVAGTLKGRRLVAPPAGDLALAAHGRSRAREALFSILQRWGRGAFLDLCAGTGAVGLEAHSRGFGPVVCEMRRAGLDLPQAKP